MKKIISILCIIMGLLLLNVLSLKEAFGAEKKLLGLGATQAASSHYVYFVGLSKVLNARVPEVNVTVVETGAGVDNIRRMAKGELDFGLCPLHIHYQAYYGFELWKGNPVKNVYTLWVYGRPAPQNIIVREDSGVRSIYDLTGKPFNPGMRGSEQRKR